MDCSFGIGGPAILQLHRWSSSQPELNLSEFHQAFFSPTRELLLLLTRQHEALLLPFHTGYIYSDDSRLQPFRKPGRSASDGNIQSTFVPVPDVGTPCLKRTSSRSSGCFFVCDVSSLAWGIFADTYNQHSDDLFREFLFVANENGVTVHSFCKLENADAFSETDNTDFQAASAMEGKFAQGRWLDWGPSSRSGQNVEAHCSDVDDDLSGDDASNSKRWLRSYFMKVETTKSVDKIWTLFPERSSFPPSARVVSFRVLGTDLLPLQLLNDTCHYGIDGFTSCNCCRMFSNNSYDLIGFILTLGFPCSISANAEGGRERNGTKKSLIVARLNPRGIQWVSLVILPECLNLNCRAEWIDFCFHDNFIICLNLHGFVYFFSVTTGEHIVHLDVLCLQEKMSATTNAQMKGEECLYSRRMFRKLLVSSQNSLLAAVDECGVIYIFSVSECLPGDTCSYEKLLHASWMLADWKAGGVSVASSMAFSRADDFEVYRSLTRRVVLSVEKFKEDDDFCFSPLGITGLIKKPNALVIHLNVNMESTVLDDQCLNSGTSHVFNFLGMAGTAAGEIVSCTFQGFLYLVTNSGVSVVLPSVSVSSNFLPVESLGYHLHNGDRVDGMHVEKTLQLRELEEPFLPWKVEVLDRILVYEGSEEADRLCMENGWSMKISRLRQLQVALEYLKFDEIEHSLQMLVDINLAEEGILRLLLAVICIIYERNDTDMEVSAASRLLALGSNVTMKVIRNCSLCQDNVACHSDDFGHLQLVPKDKPSSKTKDLRVLNAMSRYLETIRKIQCRLSATLRHPSLVSCEESSSFVDADHLQDRYQLSISGTDRASLDKPYHQKKLACISVPAGSVDVGFPIASSKGSLDSDASFVDDPVKESVFVPLENSKEMIVRWESENLNFETMVRDALLSDRLPLAVLQLHLCQSRHLDDDKEPVDSFMKVKDVGFTISYELFSKHETQLAIEMLQKLGEPIESCMRQLLFGTVRRCLRLQVGNEMKVRGYLSPYDLNIMERIFNIERLYPSSRFWESVLHRQVTMGSTFPSDRLGGIKLHLSHPCLQNSLVECGEVDGVVLGSWANVDGSSCDSVADESAAGVGYWSAAAVWYCDWDCRTIQRIILDHPSRTDHVFLEWESRLQYYACHNDWDEVCKLFSIIPPSLLLEESMMVTFVCSMEETASVSIDIPGIKRFNFSFDEMCTMWLKVLMEENLARQSIFMNKFWEGSDDIVSLLCRSDFVASKTCELQSEDVPSIRMLHAKSLEAAYGLLVRHCVHHDLPNLLDLYLCQQEAALDIDSLGLSLTATGGCHWAKWLILSLIDGHEYDSSFCNALSIVHPKLTPNEVITSVDGDEYVNFGNVGGRRGAMAALATMMFAEEPIQSCIRRGSMNGQTCYTFHCSLEDLRPALQNFPTLWDTLVSACLDLDAPSILIPASKKDVFHFLKWRENIFFSSAGDTSLLQMVPYWFPKNVRRLIQLYIKGPLEFEPFLVLPTEGAVSRNDIEPTDVCGVSWEKAMLNCVEKELYDSSCLESGTQLYTFVQRGCALAAFNHVLEHRVKTLKTMASRPETTQSDVQTLLAQLTETEKAIVSSVIPLAIENFNNLVLVSSCAFLLELCGVSATALRVDVSALRRIYSFEKYGGYNASNSQFSVMCSESHPPCSHMCDPVETLACSLAKECMYASYVRDPQLKASSLPGKHPSEAVVRVLRQLEKASLPQMISGDSCGLWLLTGNGNGAELRSQQKAASTYWDLVSTFCRTHHLPLSTKYLALLAKDNDWVGFLTEAQTGGYSFDMVLQIVEKFNDSRLKNHISMVLTNMAALGNDSSLANSDNSEKCDKASCLEENSLFSVELFKILAESEKQMNPGEFLLFKAKEISWSFLAVIASCFPDVSPMSCLKTWLEIIAARSCASLMATEIASQIANNTKAAIETTNSLPPSLSDSKCHCNQLNQKRRKLVESNFENLFVSDGEKQAAIDSKNHCAIAPNGAESLSEMIAVFCGKKLFLPLLKAFEMFLPSCCMLPFIRGLQAFSQMRLSDASAHLSSFSVRMKEEQFSFQSTIGKENVGSSWISSTAVKVANVIVSTCPPYEKKCLLDLLVETDFGDGGLAAMYYGRIKWKVNLAESLICKNIDVHLGDESLDDASLLKTLEKYRLWEEARDWAKQLQASDECWKSSVHHVTETQAETMVAEWKEFLWDISEERVSLWNHCQILFTRYSFPPLKAGSFFLKHAEALEKDLPGRELLELLLRALQWLSGFITLSNPVYPVHLLREIESRAWLLAVEADVNARRVGDSAGQSSGVNPTAGSASHIIDRTANVIAEMDDHLASCKGRGLEAGAATSGSSVKKKRRGKSFALSDSPSISSLGGSFSKWEDKVELEELETAVLSLLEFGQLTAAKQLQYKFSAGHTPREFVLADAALELASLSTSCDSLPQSIFDEKVCSLAHALNVPPEAILNNPFQVLECLQASFEDGRGRSLCRKIMAIVKAANVLGLSFAEAFNKQPVELLQLLSLKAHESFEEASLLVQTHSLPVASVAQILAESFLRGLLAAHRGGYMDFQEEEGPAPLLWRSSDFIKWAKLCPSEPEIGHALMRLIITGKEIPHACEVELLILSHHLYKSSCCLDGVDVLTAFAATRVEAYLSEGNFSCLARLVAGVGNFHALNFVVGMLVECGKLDLLLEKHSSALDTNKEAAETTSGFRMAVLSSLKHLCPMDLDALTKVYSHLDMKYEAAMVLEAQAWKALERWCAQHDRHCPDDLLESMQYFMEAAEAFSSTDAGNKASGAWAQASLISLQIRMPDSKWLKLSETHARRLLVEQSRFQEALTVAEAYRLNQPTEWAPVLWNRMPRPELMEEFVAEFVSILPFRPSMLIELAKFYRSEVVARSDQSPFSVWLTGGGGGGGGGGVPAEWAKYLRRSFRSLLKRTRNMKLRMQLAALATGFDDVVRSCAEALDEMPENSVPLVLRRGHGGAYLPLM